MQSTMTFLVLPKAIVSGPSSVSYLPFTSPLLIAQEDVIISSSKSFEPIMPDGSVLMGMLSIVLLSGLAFYVWQEQVVPVSRTKLALSKRSGSVKQYLDDLSATEEANRMDNDEDTVSSPRNLERWLFTDWLVQREKKLKGQSTTKKEPALPILKDARWNSGDNPVLAATGLIGICVLVASLTERIFQ